MAVFVSASDESAGKNRRDQFLFAGWIASERDWSEIFAPAWQRLVLDGPPQIPCLHMTDLRSRQWRDDWGLSVEDADHRIDESIAVLSKANFIYPIGVTVSGEDICDKLATAKVKSRTGGSGNFEPDYLCFLGYAMMALNYVAEEHPECEKLDFIVEQNGKITDYIRDFHSGLSTLLKGTGRPDLSELVGELIPAGKERIPVQAADVLCWHTARAKQRSSMDANDIRRYELLSRKPGRKESITTDLVELLADSLLRPE
ncbi:MAG: hypothetical protein ABI380_10080 [Edaphobacter sp.]